MGKTQELFDKHSQFYISHADMPLLSYEDLQQLLSDRDKFRTCGNCTFKREGELIDTLEETTSPQIFCKNNKRLYTIDDTCKMFNPQQEPT